MSARKHLVQIWRNPVPSTVSGKREWQHRFVHANSRQLTRQSEGIIGKATAVKSACTSYGLGELRMVDQTDGVSIWESSLRADVVVRIEDHG